MVKNLELFLKKGAEEVGVVLTPPMIQMLLIYLKELKEWNEKINLTSLKDDSEIITKHFFDSLALAPFLPPEATLLDIGSGAGFPGIPLKIALPTLTVTLLEATEKKIRFQQHLIRTLGLSHITSIHNRAENEDLIKEYGLNFDIVVSRACASFKKFCQHGKPFVKIGGYLVAMKGRRGMEELQESQDVVEKLSFEVDNIVEISLPLDKGKRYLMFMKKR